MKGVKLHFANSGVDIRNPEHLAKVQKFFRAANDHKLAIVVHIRSLRRDYGRRDAEIFINDVLPVAPDIPIQIAHLAGSGRATVQMRQWRHLLRQLRPEITTRETYTLM